MVDRDLQLRLYTSRLFIAFWRAPTVADVAAVVGTAPADVTLGWSPLHAERAWSLDE